ncbi:hypothetical protein Q9966_011129 [Columba livia]|nr:hypothetical protein Q9966_011129 [Columba livia]
METAEYAQILTHRKEQEKAHRNTRSLSQEVSSSAVLPAVVLFPFDAEMILSQMCWVSVCGKGQVPWPEGLEKEELHLNRTMLTGGSGDVMDILIQNSKFSTLSCTFKGTLLSGALSPINLAMSAATCSTQSPCLCDCYIIHQDEVEKAQQYPKGRCLPAVRLPIANKKTEPNWYGDKHTEEAENAGHISIPAGGHLLIYLRFTAHSKDSVLSQLEANPPPRHFTLLAMNGFGAWLPLPNRRAIRYDEQSI